MLSPKDGILSLVRIIRARECFFVLPVLPMLPVLPDGTAGCPRHSVGWGRGVDSTSLSAPSVRLRKVPGPGTNIWRSLFQKSGRQIFMRGPHVFLWGHHFSIWRPVHRKAFTAYFPVALVALVARCIHSCAHAFRRHNALIC